MTDREKILVYVTGRIWEEKMVKTDQHTEPVTPATIQNETEKKTKCDLISTIQKHLNK